VMDSKGEPLAEFEAEPQPLLPSCAWHATCDDPGAD